MFEKIEIEKRERILIIAIIILLVVLFITIYMVHDAENICNKTIKANQDQLLDNDCIKQCFNIQQPTLNINFTWRQTT